MTEHYIGEIRMFGGNFAPRNWALCAGQIITINSNQTLYSLLGTTYGGDGRTSFGLPDLRSRVPMGEGSGPGLTPRPWGLKFGEEWHYLSTNEMPAHTHSLMASKDTADSNNPGNQTLADTGSSWIYQKAADVANTLKEYPTNCLQNAGGTQHHLNMGPYMTINYIIATNGIYPSRN